MRVMGRNDSVEKLFEMAAIVPEKTRIKSFRRAADFERWLSKHHDREPEIWLRIFKKGSGIPTVTPAEALDVALCWGWIDAIRKSFDDKSFLQRYTPRGAKSLWSQINRQNVTRLIKQRRMRKPGLRQVEAAKADGRWDRAYAPIRTASRESIPPDLRAAIDANPNARKTFESLGKVNLFALAFRTNNMKTSAGRARKIAELVAMLSRGETIVPEKRVDLRAARST